MRLKGWERRFINNLQYELEQPFHWVRNNCGHLIAAAVRACHGEHPLLDHLINLDSQEKVECLIRERTLRGLIEEHFETVPKVMGQDADIGVFVGIEGTEVGCVLTGGVAIARVAARDNGKCFRLPISMLDVVYRV